MTATSHGTDSTKRSGVSVALFASPLLAVLAIVISVYVDRGQVLESLMRPLLIASVVVIGVQLTVTGLSRRADLGVAITLLAVLGLIDPRMPILVLAGWGIARELARRRGWALNWKVVATPITVVFVVSVLRLVVSPAFTPSDLFPRQPATPEIGAAGGPDIFLVLLDGYPRSDTLGSLGYDNSWFEAELRARGFSVASASHSNYEFTYLVIPTMFHMRHASQIQAIRTAEDGWVAHRRAIRSAIETAPSFVELRAAGYEVVSAGAPGTPLSLSPVADYIDTGGMHQFERELLDATFVGRSFPEIALSQHRDRVSGAFDATEAVAHDDAATFMFTHIVSPHVPFVFDREGSMPHLDCAVECHRYEIYSDRSGMTREQFITRYTDQVDYINGRVLSTVDAITKESRDAVIVLFSDHGTRSEYELSAEWFASFFASRTPGRDDLFPSDARPIEILPVLLNSYLRRDIAIPPDVTYYSPSRGARPLHVKVWNGHGS